MEKRRNYFKVFVGFLGLCAFWFSCQIATAEDQVEKIESFKTIIDVKQTSEVVVEEEIAYLFPEPRHGIIRKIPFKYRLEDEKGQTRNYQVNFKLLEAKKLEGQDRWEAVDFKIKNEGDNKVITLGTEKETFTGLNKYRIVYSVQKVITFEPEGNADQDEFFWNTTGNGWTVPIGKTETVINFPVEIDPEKWAFACFTGPLGSTESECSFEALGKNQIKFENKWELGGGEGLSVLAGFPRGIVNEPTASENFWFNLKYNLFYYAFLLIPILAFFILFALWFLRGRDPGGKGTIIPFYSPPDNLTPVEIGTLFDEKADPKDFSSSIINLAVKGYFKIKETEEKPILGIFKNKPSYEIIIRKKDDLPPGAEREIFETVYNLAVGGNPVTLARLRDVFPQKIGSMKTSVYDGLVKKGYFSKNPESVRNAYFLVGGLVFILGLVFTADAFGLIGAGSLAVTGLMIVIFGYFMPQKTIKGVNAREKILGLKEYLEVAEKDRIQFHNAPAKKPELFEKLLPYAMILGVEKEWAGQFQGIYTANPSWYEGSSPATNFNTLYFVNTLSSFSQEANLSMGIKTQGGVSAGGGSGFGGGGFSGGGFGGGGGSSW